MTKKTEKKVEKIIQVLRNYPEGLWIRELSRKTKIDKSTISRYISLYMKEKTETEIIGNLVKIVKLKK